MRLIDEILNDINQAKQKITSVELEIGHASGPSKQVDTLIQAENLLTYCHSRLSDIDPESLRPQGEWILGVVEAGYFTPGGNRPWICSRCGVVKSWMLDKPSEKYCHECGAKMKVGVVNE